MTIKEKIQYAVRDMGSKIERDDKHIYRDKNTGNLLQGVTSVSHIVPKDWLAAWGAKEAVKYLGYSDYKEDTKEAEAILDELKHCTLEEYIEILHTAKGASGRKSKKAMVDGKLGHSWLESFVQAKIEGKDVPNIPIGILERPLRQFCDWEAIEIDHWIASEGLICNLLKYYAGQFDAIARLKSGWLALIDFKFSGHIADEYSLQTAGYAACFESYGIKFDERIIIRLPKTIDRDEWNDTTHQYEKKPNNIEVYKIPTDYERDRDAFYASLVVKSWINHLEKIRK